MDVTRQFGTSVVDVGKGIAIDGAGNLWVVGDSDGDLSGASPGDTNVFVRGYPADGSAPKTYHLGTSNPDYGSAVASDELGNVWVAGDTLGDLAETSLGDYDAFVRVYPADDSAPKTYQFGTASLDHTHAIALDAAGNVWVAGNTGGDLAATNLGGYDAFLRQYPADGSAPKTYQFGSQGDEYPRAITVDSAGNVWLTGNTNGDLITGGNADSHDAFLREYPADGSAPITFQFGTPDNELADAIAVDAAGNVWVAGNTNGNLAATNLGDYDAFVREYPADGSAPKTYQFGTSGYDSATAIATDNAGNVWVTGTTAGNLFASNLGSDDIFVIEYPADGAAAKSYQFGTDGLDGVKGIAADQAGNVWLAGATSGSMAGTNQGFHDVFVRQIAQ